MKREAVTNEWTKTKADSQAVAEGCYFDLAAAERFPKFLKQFVKIPTKGSTKPATLLPWQWEALAPLLGWKRKDGKRRFKRAYISTAKKNGKTQALAFLLLYLLVTTGQGQELYSIATEREQAAQIYREAARLIKASPELKAILTTHPTTKTITFDQTATFFRAWSSDVESKEGPNVSFLVYDELHAAKRRELFDTLTYAGAAQEFRTGEPPLFVYTTTAGYDRTSICYEQYQYAKAILSGENLDTGFHAYIREADPADDWKKETTWHKANPGLGTVLSLADFRSDFEEARKSPAKQNAFKRYRLNQWTEVSTRWLPLDLWDKNGSPINLENYYGRTCYAGLDLASKQDTSSLVLAFHNDIGGYDLIPFIWIPEENMVEKGLAHGVPYSVWAGQGIVEATPGNAIDYDVIRRRVSEIGEQFKIDEIAFDPWNATQLEGQLTSDGFTMLPTRQGFSLSSAAKELFRLLLGQKINHGNHKAMRWQAGNVEAKLDQHENIQLHKPGGKDSTKKIDSIVAAVMAIDRAMRHAAEEETSDSAMCGIAFI